VTACPNPWHCTRDQIYQGLALMMMLRVMPYCGSSLPVLADVDDATGVFVCSHRLRSPDLSLSLFQGEFKSSGPIWHLIDFGQGHTEPRPHLDGHARLHRAKRDNLRNAVLAILSRVYRITSPRLSMQMSTSISG